MLKVLLVLASLVGVLLAGYSIYEHILVLSGVDTGSSVCNISATVNCAGVIKSGWSTFLGLPLGAYGIGFFVFVLASLVRAEFFSDAKSLKSAFFFSILSVLSSVFLFGVSKFIIGVLCPVCIAMYFVNIFVFILLLIITKEHEATLLAGIVHFKNMPIVFLISALTLFSSPHLVKSMTGNTLSASALKVLKEERLIASIADWKRAPEQTIPIEDGSALTKDFSVGPVLAPITVVEYFDYECPACRSFYFELKTLIDEYKDEIRVVYKNYPLDNKCNSEIKDLFHQSACEAAEYARCAGEQGQFSEALGYIMSLDVIDNQGSRKAVSEALIKGYGDLSLDSSAMQECLDSDRQLAKIRDDIKVATELELRGTPSVWVNGRKAPSVSSVVLRKIFDDILKKGA